MVALGPIETWIDWILLEHSVPCFPWGAIIGSRLYWFPLVPERLFTVTYRKIRTGTFFRTLTSHEELPQQFKSQFKSCNKECLSEKSDKFRSTWLAQSLEHMILYLRVMSSGPALGVEPTFKKIKIRIKRCLGASVGWASLISAGVMTSVVGIRRVRLLTESAWDSPPTYVPPSAPPLTTCTLFL